MQYLQLLQMYLHMSHLQNVLIEDIEKFCKKGMPDAGPGVTLLWFNTN